MSKSPLLKIAEDAQATTYAGTGAKIGLGTGILAGLYKGIPKKQVLATGIGWGLAGLLGGGLINRNRQPSLKSKEETNNV
jgi:hypothetical protein